MSHVQHSPAARTWAASISFPRTPPRPARPASNSRTSWSAPACGTSRSARTWTAPRPAAGPAWRPPSRRNTCPITTPPAWRNRWAWTAAPTKARWSAILLAMLGSPVPFPSRPCPSWSPPSASAAASSRPRARPPWPSTPSTPSAPRAIGPTTKNAASPSCPAARSSKACAAPRSPRPRASSTPSCYRATEYVTVLGIAQELEEANPALARDLQRQWETRAVMSGRFHDTFLHEYGSLAEPCRATGSGSAIRTPLRPTWKAMKAPGCSTWAAACSIISGNATSPSR